MGITFAALSAYSFGGRIALIVASSVLAIILLSFSPSRRFAYLPLFVFTGAVLFLGFFDVYRANRFEGGNYYITAEVVSEIVPTGDGGYKLYIGKMAIDEERLVGTALIKIDGPPQGFNAGDTVKIYGRVTKTEFEAFNSYFAANYRAGNIYKTYVKSIEKLAEGKPSFALAAEMRVKKAFFTACKEDTAAICTALLYGDKINLSSALYDDVKTSGLAHILAVSGLHFSVLAAAITFILKKFKANAKVRFVIVTAVMLFYAYVCSFTASVMRAVIMAVVFLAADALGKKTDSLSALGLSAIIILVSNPVNLFEVGFLLSMTSVAGILIFYDSCQKIFKKTGRVISPVISTSISANIGTFPVSCHFFGSFNVFFLVSNILVLPLMNVVFIISLVCSLIVLIIPVYGFLVIFDYLLIPFKVVAFTLSSLKIASVPMPSLGLLTFGYYIVFLICSKFVFLTKREKAISCSAVASIFLALSAVASLF